MSSAAVSTRVGPSLRLLLEQTTKTRPVQFDEAFIERRMRQHRELQRRMACDLTADIIDEVLSLEAPNVLE